MILGVLFGATLMWFAFSVHVIKHNDDWHFIPREKTQLSDFYSDVTRWDSAEWSKHPDLKSDVIKSGNAVSIPELKFDPEVLLMEAARKLEARRDSSPSRR